MATNVPPRILVIEDEKAYARALTLKLQNAGFEVVSAAQGEEGLAAIAAKPFDLILCDLIMPKLNGFGVLEALRDQHSVTPVIVLSNLTQEDDEKKARALGAVDFVAKSNISLAEMIEKVKKFAHPA